MQFPAQIQVWNYGAGDDTFQKKLRIKHPSLPGGEVSIEPAQGQWMTVNEGDPAPTVEIGDWATGFPISFGPATPQVIFNYASHSNPRQPWHANWNTGGRIAIAAFGATPVNFASPTDTSVLSFQPGV